MYFIIYFSAFLVFAWISAASSTQCNRTALHHSTEDLKSIVADKYDAKSKEDLNNACRNLENKLLQVLQDAKSCQEDPHPFVTEEAIPVYFICIYERKPANVILTIDESCDEQILQNAVGKLKDMLHNRKEKSLHTDEERRFLCRSLEDNLLTVLGQTEKCNQELDVYITNRTIPAYFECVYVYGHTAKNQEVARCKYAILDGLIGCRYVAELPLNQDVSECSTIEAIVLCARNRSETSCKNGRKTVEKMTSIWTKTLKTTCKKAESEIKNNPVENEDECHKCMQSATTGLHRFFNSSAELNEACHRTYSQSKCLSMPTETCPEDERTQLLTLRFVVKDFLVRLCLPGSIARKDFLDASQCISTYNFQRLTESCEPKPPPIGPVSEEEGCKIFTEGLRCLKSKIEVLCGFSTWIALEDHLPGLSLVLATKCANATMPTLGQENDLQ